MRPSRARLLACLLVAGLAAACGDGGDQPARSAGTLDRKFGTRGEVTTDFGHYALLWALDEAADGRIVAAGRTFPARAEQRFGLARYRADGSLDESFGTRGLVETRVARETTAVAVDARDDGTTIVLGWSRDAFASQNLTLARYDDHGRLVRGFGSGGIVVTSAPDVLFSPVGFLATADGTILVGGSYSIFQRAGMFFARYLADGRLDPSFGVGGTALIDTGFTGYLLSAATIARRPDGTLTAAQIVYGESRVQLVFLRLTPDGAVDGSFGDGGHVAVDRDGFFDDVVGTLPDGSVVISTYESDDTTRLQRYRADGTLDPGFASPALPGSPTAMTTDAGGNLVLTLESFISDVVVVARVLPSGALDPTFGDAGMVTIPGPGALNGLIVPRTGGIVAGGWLSRPGLHHLEFTLRRYYD